MLSKESNKVITLLCRMLYVFIPKQFKIMSISELIQIRCKNNKKNENVEMGSTPPVHKTMVIAINAADE